MGPNSRKQKSLPPPLSHKDVDKMFRASRNTKRPREGWIIQTRFPDGGIAYRGQTRTGSVGLTPFRTNAIKYESENAARYVAYESARLRPFEVVHIPAPKQPANRETGTGGRP